MNSLIDLYSNQYENVKKINIDYKIRPHMSEPNKYVIVYSKTNDQFFVESFADLYNVNYPFIDRYLKTLNFQDYNSISELQNLLDIIRSKVFSYYEPYHKLSYNISNFNSIDLMNILKLNSQDITPLEYSFGILFSDYSTIGCVSQYYMTNDDIKIKHVTKTYSECYKVKKTLNIDSKDCIDCHLVCNTKVNLKELKVIKH